jgi:glutaminyl-tRNA synthetase
MNKKNIDTSNKEKEVTAALRSDFIRSIVDEDLLKGKNDGKVVTRFPPEPNGYLHIGHAKSICLNFDLARDYNGRCHLRFDDTNPVKEDIEYMESIKEDVKWLGYDWGEYLYFASDYFDKLYECAVKLIKGGKAYIDSLNAEEIRQYRGTLKEPGRESPYRNRDVDENLELFERMRMGEFPDGSHVLRAKIDMSSPNIVMRDPTLYRIKHESHHRTGLDWKIYPMYDFAHCISDSIEGITHSICTLEFEINRPLYDWVLDELDMKCHPQQIEFARLNLTYTVMSKRKLLRLVEGGYVNGWDDPRMPTISGLRRRGYPPEVIREFCRRIGVAKSNSIVDIALLEHILREYLNMRAPRRMAVLRPLRLIIENYPEGKVEELDAENNPEDAEMGSRKIHFSRELYIDQNDFREDPPKKYFRLAPGSEVRLKHAYYIKCKEVIKDENTGKITELRCTYDPETRGGWSRDGRKVKGTLHWISAAHALPARIHLYDRLFSKENPDETVEGEDFTVNLNHDSLKVLQGCFVEKSLADSKPGNRFQFLREGYFCADKDSGGGELVFNQTVPLKDTWLKIEKTQERNK